MQPFPIELATCIREGRRRISPAREVGGFTDSFYQIWSYGSESAIVFFVVKFRYAVIVEYKAVIFTYLSSSRNHLKRERERERERVEEKSDQTPMRVHERP